MVSLKSLDVNVYYENLSLTRQTVYTSFIQKGRKSAKWCHSHRLNFKALSRAVSIRQQLLKYMQRFKIPIESCNDNDQAIRRCLVSGYFKNAAKFSPDGTYRLLRENAVSLLTCSMGVFDVPLKLPNLKTLHVHPSSIMFTRTPSTGYVIFHDIVETTKTFMRDITVIDSDW